MDTLNAAASSFYAWGQDQGETLAPDQGTPQVGDSIAFFGPGTVSAAAYADHVGVVTSVNADGTINMVNGDFLGSDGITVEYNTNLDLSTWPASEWGAGEQWVIMHPARQRAAPGAARGAGGPAHRRHRPVGHVPRRGQRAGRLGQPVLLDVRGRAFGQLDGRGHGQPRVPRDRHLHGDGHGDLEPGHDPHPDLGRGRQRRVLGRGRRCPRTRIWYATAPVDEYLFTHSAGGLAADQLGWRQLAAGRGARSAGRQRPGRRAQPTRTRRSSDAMTPHAYYRAADGSLAETYLGASGWVTQELPGQPVAGSAITAAYTNGQPAVFYAGAGGHPAETAEGTSGWTATDPARRPGAARVAHPGRHRRAVRCSRPSPPAAPSRSPRRPVRAGPPPPCRSTRRAPRWPP